MTPPLGLREQDEHERSRLLRVLLFLGVGLTYISSTAQWLLVGPSLPQAINMAAMTLAAAGSLLLLRRGKVDAAGWLACSIAGGGLVVLSASQGGADAPALAGLLVVIATAALFIDGRASFVFTVLAMLATVGLEVAREQGVLPPPPPGNATAHAIGLFGAAPMLAAILALTLRRLRATLRGAQHAATTLQTSVEETERQRLLLLRRARQQATVARLAQLALSGQPLEGFLKGAMEDVRELLQVEACFILELSADQSTLAGRAAVGEVDVSQHGGPAQHSVAGFALSEGLAVVSADVTAESRFAAAGLAAAGFRGVLAAPIHGSERPWGVVVACARRASAFSLDDGHFAELLANLLGVAIEREASARALAESESQLRQATKMEAVGRLAGGVAHDFNNLMTAVLAYADFLLPAIADETMRDDVRSIREAAERAAALTRQLLAFSRRQVLQPRLLDPNTVVASMDKMLRRVIGEDVELVTALGAEVGFTLVDPVQLEQVLLNLVVNAREALPKGGRLEVATRRVELGRDLPVGKLAAGPCVLLTVRDNGVGMSKEVQERVFEPFFTTKPQGTGLGLSTVYGIVIQSGGEVRVSSVQGDGTTFEILLPRHERPVDRPAGAAAEPAKAASARRVLVVEDDLQVRRVVMRVLKIAGYEVTEAQDGLDALEVLGRGGAFDVMLSDIVMPKMSGAELSRHVAERYPKVKCVLMSGYAAEALERHGPLDANVELVRKPFTSAQLLSALSKAAERN